jgi:ParB-like chromosome segregation protein Spo0J
MADALAHVTQGTDAAPDQRAHVAITAPAGNSGHELMPHAMAMLFPPLSADDFDKLKQSVADHGQFQPIVIDNNQILEGCHRYEACCELGIEPKLVPFSQLGLNISIEEFIFESNIRRRHLTDDQRAQLAAEFLPFFRAEAAESKAGSLQKARTAKAEKSVDPKSCPQSSSARDNKTKHRNSTAGKLAEKAEVSEYRAENAIRLESHPDLAGRVISGELTQREATKELEERQTSSGESVPPKPKKPKSRERLIRLIDTACRNLFKKVRPGQHELLIDLIIDHVEAQREYLDEFQQLTEDDGFPSIRELA